MNLTTLKDYCLGSQLGQGAFAKVREAIHIQTGYKVAIKIYDRRSLELKFIVKQCVQREIQVLSKIMEASISAKEGDLDALKSEFDGHENIMQLYDAFDHHNNVCLVVENCKGKPLDEVLKFDHHHQAPNNLP